jgi:hypothetical protein
MAVAAAEVDADALLARTQQMTVTLIADRLTLRFVAGHLPAEQRDRVARSLRDDQLPGDPFAGEQRDFSKHPVLVAWKVACENLCRDVDAPLPVSRDV